MAGSEVAEREKPAEADKGAARALAPDLSRVEPKSIQTDSQLAGSFNNASSPKQFGEFEKNLGTALSDAYTKGGMSAVDKKIKDIDSKIIGDNKGLWKEHGPDNTLLVKGLLPISEGAFNGLPEDKKMAFNDKSGKRIYTEIKSTTVIDLNKLDQANATVTDAGAKPNDVPKWGVKRTEEDAKTPISPYVWAGFQKAVEDKFGKGVIPGSEPARELIERANGLGLELKDLPPGLFEFVAGQGSEGKKLVQDLMDKHQVPLKVPDAGEDAVHGGSVLDYNVKWKAAKTDVEINGQQYQAFRKDARVMMVGDQPVVEVYKDHKTGLALYMAKHDEELPGLTAYDKALQLTPGAGAMRTGYSEAILPNVDYMDKGKVPQLDGTVMADGRNFKFQSYTKVRIDAEGAVIKQALQGTGTRSMGPPPPYTLDGPALVWLSHPKATRPLFAFRASEAEFEKKR